MSISGFCFVGFLFGIVMFIEISRKVFWVRFRPLRVLVKWAVANSNLILFKYKSESSFAPCFDKDGPVESYFYELLNYTVEVEFLEFSINIFFSSARP